VAGADMARGRWARGAEVQVDVRGADDAPVSAKASIEAGARGAVVHVPLTAAQSGPWRVTVHVADAQDAVDEQITVDAADASVVSAAVAYRATPSPRSPLRAVADSQYRRPSARTSSGRLARPHSTTERAPCSIVAASHSRSVSRSASARSTAAASLPATSTSRRSPKATTSWS
jgi:hypothetical protein